MGRLLTAPLQPCPLSSYTDADGRCPGLLTPGQMKAGTYKLLFDTQDYWERRGQASFYPHVEVRAAGRLEGWRPLTHWPAGQVQLAGPRLCATGRHIPLLAGRWQAGELTCLSSHKKSVQGPEASLDCP